MDQERLAEWLAARLAGPTAEEEWTRAVVSATDRALAASVETGLPPEAFNALLDAWLTPERFAGYGALAMFFVPEGLVEARQLDEPIGTWLGEDTRAALVELVRRPGWVSDGWVREVFAQQVSEDVFYDVLQRGLRDFSTLIPRVLERFLPGGLGRLARLGTRASTRAFDEVERLLEGEIKGWLERGARRSVDAATQLAIERLDGPAGQTGRENLLRFGLEKSPAQHVDPFDEDVTAAARRVAELVARDLGRYPRGIEAVRNAAQRVYARYGPRPLAELLEDAGLLAEPLPSEAWARATWPAVSSWVRSPESEAFLHSLASDLLTWFAAESA